VRVVVTGASGYLGGRLCATLTDSGIDVVAVSRRDAEWVRSSERVRLDVSSDDAAAVLEGADAVVHLAGANEVDAAHDPDGTTCAAITAARRIAAAAPRGCRVVHVSTVHVYGASMASGGSIDESTLPAPRHPYALARLASEHLLGSRDDTVVLRLTNSVGAPLDPRIDRWSLVANDLCREAAVHHTVTLRTHGLQWRDFVHQGDACRIIAAAADPERVPPGTYNLGAGRSMTVRALAGLVQDAFERLTGDRPRLVAPDAPPDAPPEVTIDVSRLARLGLRAELPIAEAVEETARFCLDAPVVAARG
jgi:UDP-glucose 4-epimerase